MNDVYVTIHPEGWLVLAAFVIVVCMIGYIMGFYNGFKTAHKEKEKQLFDFESK